MDFVTMQLKKKERKKGRREGKKEERKKKENYRLIFFHELRSKNL